jgi:hypothetical protein
MREQSHVSASQIYIRRENKATLPLIFLRAYAQNKAEEAKKRLIKVNRLNFRLMTQSAMLGAAQLSRGSGRETF